MSEDKHRPFCHRVSLENIERFKNSTPEERLQWLEDAFRFVVTVVPEKDRKTWERYRQSQTQPGR